QFDDKLSVNQLDPNKLFDTLTEALGGSKTPEGAPKPEPTRIKTAAIRHDGKIYTGAIHPDAVAKIAHEMGEDVSTDDKFSAFYTKHYENMSEGFLTDTDEFVGRQRAADIAQRAGQYKEPRRGTSSLDALEAKLSVKPPEG